MRVVSIGDLVTDYYYKNGKLIGVNGGMTSHNIIANISKMNLDTSVFGVCGNDEMGKVAIKSLEDIGVDTSNIKIIDNLKTRCFHVSYFEEDGKLKFKSKKRCPLCNLKKWYEESKIDVDDILKNKKVDDILVFDNLNDKNVKVIDNCNNRKMLDLGQYFELDNYTDKEILEKINNKFDIINLNERVEDYLKKRFSLKSINDIYKLFNPKMLLVTRGKIGSDFVYSNIKITKTLDNPEVEVDPTGAGDAFFATFICEYIKNNFFIDEEFINKTYEKATKLTRKVVKKFGARGHINSLYKIKKENNACTCEDFEITVRKKIKRCNINVNNLEIRVINAINSNAYKKLKEIDFHKIKNSLFLGTGGSFSAAIFASKVINDLYGNNTISLLPRDAYYRNNSLVDSIFLFSYSGTTNDLFVSTASLDNKLKYVITKGEVGRIVTKTNISKDNIITYRTGTNKGKERGYLSFEGTLAPSSLFLKLYFDIKGLENIDNFIRESLDYWKKYFNNYFNSNKEFLNKFFKPKNCFNIFIGDFTSVAGTDLESKIIESGIFNCLIHEKKNFSHGRFINYEHLSDKKNIYFRQKNITKYEEELLNYLEKDMNLVVESRYNGILCEYDLLVASQYLIYYISNHLDIDISKPTYSEEAMKIYFYKGEV